MNYQRIYDELIESARFRAISGYVEIHHVIPKCMGGLDTGDNLVSLSGREHFIAHWLLFKIHGTHQLAYAWNAMCMTRIELGRTTSRSFQYARAAAGRAQSDRISGEGHHMFGKHHTEETKSKISESNKGLIKHSLEARELRRQWVKEGRTGMLGMNHSEESKKKISESRKGRFGKAVICTLSDGSSVEYTTAGIAMDDGFDSSSIIKCCKGKAKTHKGCTWKYAGGD